MMQHERTIERCWRKFRGDETTVVWRGRRVGSWADLPEDMREDFADFIETVNGILEGLI